MAAYRVFTQGDLKNYHDASGYPFSGLKAPYLCLNWNLFQQYYGPASSYPLSYGMPTTNLNDYKANPTKLILRRHINIDGIDAPNTFPDV